MVKATMFNDIEWPKIGYLIAVDPGDVHCGIATFFNGSCANAFEYPPETCVDYIYTALTSTPLLNVLVVEEFRLYPWEAENQMWSQFKTCEVIGQLRLLWRWFGHQTLWCEQGANIKKPTTGILRGRRIASKAKALRAGGHALDAELHGYHFLYRYAEQKRDFYLQHPEAVPF